MLPNDISPEDSMALITEIEQSLESVFKKRREDVDRELQETINREKEVAAAKISLIEREMDSEREALKEFRAAVAEFESSRRSIQDELQGHLDLAMRHQRDIETLITRTLDELRTVNDLSLKLAGVWRESEAKLAELRARLKERFGLVAEPDKGPDAPDMATELEREIQKLVKIKDLLDKETNNASGAAAAKEQAGSAVQPPPSVIDGSAAGEPHQKTEFDVPEINKAIEEMLKQSA